ncbi:hypothetical protein N7462_001896 [Penicillium macrosclerotiorum]|uniref:uncharacterized protein n=1 Tax=Penicillium macrosclerotiorum TaxID=303699 RepID=UPI0025499D31|nr:uncharacterized protein N7462_001896 [Penicillium macrosclerotiorum]KAJ5692473.1 hypothetical protein N7462_001896 [Penicillium macrosclerotiorum]
MPHLRVLIVGASIAGPTAAYWLSKAGAEITIIERFLELRTNGQNVDIRTVGVTVMRKMAGMEKAVRAKAVPMDGISFVDTHGRSYGIIKPTGDPDQQSLVSEYEIFRGDLSQILFNLTRDDKNIKYVFGEQVASMRQMSDRGPIAVEFANGYPCSEFDLVVACDGATSRTRAMGLECGAQDHVVPLNSWAAFFSIQKDLLKQYNIGEAYSAPGGRFIAIGSDPSGISRVVLMGIHKRSEQDSTHMFREALKQGESALKGFIKKHFQGGGWKCDEVLEDIMDSQDFYANEMVQIRVPSLYNGRFVLVGDSGYAPGPTGTGTSLAMAGAYLLAGEIHKHRCDVEAGLKGYQERMQPIVDDLQRIPPLVPTVLAPQTTAGIWLRNMIFTFICWSGIMEFSQRFFAGSFARNEVNRLPDYDWTE